MSKELINVMSAPVLGPDARRIEVAVPSGTSVEEMIALSLPGLSRESYGTLRVSLVNAHGMMPIGRDIWHVTKPKVGTRVVIRVVPGKNALRSVLMVVVAVAAMAIGQFWVAPFLTGAGFSTTAASIAAGLVTTGLTALGALLVNALIPPSKTKTADNEDAYQISGWRNKVPAAGDVVPSIFGQIRYAPPFAATSYTEIVGDDQYIRALFNFGYGAVSTTGFRIGRTSLSEYDEVQIEVRDGRADDEPVTLYPKQVLEESVSVELARPFPRDDAGTILKAEDTIETPIVRQTAVDTATVSIIIACSSGLFQASTNGTYLPVSVDIRVRQRLLGAADWSDVETLTITSSKAKPIYRQFTWNLPSRGRYEIELTRMTDERTANTVSDTCLWAGLQSIRPEYPIAFSKPIALVALRIKATYQLSGALDNFNALCQREELVYDGTQWAAGSSSNPASAYVLALQGDHNPFPAADEEIDWEVLADWHDWCDQKGLKFDYVAEKRSSLGDILAAICAAGRATPRHDGVKWSVVIDRPTELVIDHISPRNSSDFSWQRTYFDPPDGFRVSFKDASNDYESNERIVPWVGHVGAVDLTEDLELIGKTDPDEIFIEARRRMHELEHRPDSYSAIQSGLARVATRGDHVRGSYDVLTRTQISARVKSISGALIELDDAVTMEEGTSYGIRFRVFENDQDEIGTSLVREVRSQAGEYRAVVIKDKEALPALGELIHFGPLSSVDLPLVVKGIEPGNDFSAVVHMIDAAPIIDELTDAEVPPAWDGRAGEEINLASVMPTAPKITSVASGTAGTGDADGLSILIAQGSGSAAVVSSFEVDHKLDTDSSWTTLVLPVANGGAAIDGYVSADTVNIRARSVTTDGTTGAYTTTITVTIGSDDPVLPSALNAGLITATGSLGRATLSLSTTADTATAQLQLYRVPTGETLNRSTHFVGVPVAVAPSSSVNLVDGDATRTTMLSNGAFGSAEAWMLGDGWSIAGGKATHAAGTAGDLDQSMSFAEGKFYRIGFVISGVTAGNLNPLISGGG